MSIHSEKHCSISSNIREGLLEAFYGIYDKDPDRVSFFWNSMAVARIHLTVDLFMNLLLYK